MSKLFITLSILMGVVVLSSNYLVQFPFNYFGLEDLLTYGACCLVCSIAMVSEITFQHGQFLGKALIFYP